MSLRRKAHAALGAGSASQTDAWSDCETAIAPLPVDREDLAYYVRHHLNQTERLVVMLHYAEELGFDEIAGILEMAQDQVEELHQLIVARIKASLKNCEMLAGV